MTLYYCPTSMDIEDSEAGGLNICCEAPEFHELLTDEEVMSLNLAESIHTTRVRLNYFAVKRCRGCTDRETCNYHMERWNDLSSLGA